MCFLSFIATFCILEIEKEGYGHQYEAHHANNRCVELQRPGIVRVQGRLAQLEYYCADGLNRSEYAEWILARVELEAQYLLRVRVHCTIHEAPGEREGVD